MLWRVAGCPASYFGPSCSLRCKCLDPAEACNSTTGACHVSGCDDGWAGPSCYTGEWERAGMGMPHVGL